MTTTHRPLAATCALRARRAAHKCISTPTLALLAVASLSGCGVVSLAGSAAGAVVSVAGAVVSTGVSVTGKVIEKTIDVITPSSK